MKNTIRDCWLGNISESEHMTISKEYRRLDNIAEKQRNRLLDELSDQQKEMLMQYTDTMYEISSVFGEDAFVRGVSFGMRISCEAIMGEN